MLNEYYFGHFCLCDSQIFYVHHSFMFNYSGFESETDTEEFEKVGQSPIDRQRPDVTHLSATGTETSPLVATASVAVNASELACPKLLTVSMSTSTKTVSTQEASTLTEVRLNTNTPTSASYSENMMMTSLTCNTRLTTSHISINNDPSLMPTTTINPKISIPQLPPSISSFPSSDNPSIRFNNNFSANKDEEGEDEVSISSCCSDDTDINTNNCNNSLFINNNMNTDSNNHHNNNVNVANHGSRRADIGHVLSPIPECDSPASNKNPPCGDNGDGGIASSDASSSPTESIGVCDKFRCNDFQSYQEDGDSEFVNSEFYIDESLPSSMTISDPLPNAQPTLATDDGECGMAAATTHKLDDADLQQLIAEIEIFSFDSCQSNDDRILMLLQVLPPSSHH